MTTEQYEKDAAALTLLKSTGMDVLEAAQVACAVVARLRQKGYLSDCVGAYPAETLGGGHVVTLCMEVINAGVETLAAREQTVSLAEAGWASVEARRELRPTSIRDLRYFLRKILKVDGVGELPLRAITSKQCREMLRVAFGHSKSMYVKGRSLLHSVFAYGIRQEWCDANPVARIEVPKVKESAKEPLSVEAVRRLEAVVQQEQFRDMRLSLHLLLYCGVRPTEVSRLRADDFCWKEGVVIIRPQKSKTGGGRVVTMRGIKQIPPVERVIPQHWQQRWRDLRRAAGFAEWVPDVCRHTFASYHAAYFRNLPELQLEMGHRDVNLLRSRYMSPALRHDASKFWKRVSGKC